jgi:hypothetical protein
MTGTTRQQMGGKELWETIARRSLEPWLGSRQEALSGNFRRYRVVEEPGCPPQVGLAPDIYGIE